MKLPVGNSIWKQVGPGNGQGMMHQVLFADDVEVVTVSAAQFPWMIAWSGLWPLRDFFNFFQFVHL